MRETKDSGKRQEFITGAKRDTQENKPDFTKFTLHDWNDFLDIIGEPLIEIDDSKPLETNYDEDVSYDLHLTLRNDENAFVTGINFTNEEMLISILALNRWQALMQRGAKKYGKRNWEKGIPMKRFYASLFRHVIMAFLGDTSEDHLAAVLFNAAGAMEMEHLVNIGEMPKEIGNAGALAFSKNREIQDGLE